MKVSGQNGRTVSRSDNPRWQRALRDYLLSGDAVIITGGKDADIGPTTWDAIRGGGIVARDGTHVVYGGGGQDRGLLRSLRS
jgi:hypothetical protein